MDTNTANRICGTATVALGALGAIIGGQLAIAAPTWETTLAIVSGCCLGCVIGMVAWHAFAATYNAVWNRGYAEGYVNSSWERGYEDGKSFAAKKAEEDKQADSAGDGQPK